MSKRAIGRQRDLRNDGNAAAQTVQRYTADIDMVDTNAASLRLHQAKQRDHQRGFSRASAADHPNFGASRNGTIHTFG